MTVSVIIPAFNAAETIADTLGSVLSQSVQPEEILVMDDGSTDDTAPIVETYFPRVTLIRQANKGLGPTRDILCAKAAGDLVAFLDSDDLWHHRYLEVQLRMVEEHPDCVAFFTGHADIYGGAGYDADSDATLSAHRPQVMDSSAFLKRNTHMPGPFKPSFCCVPKAVLRVVGPEPFKLRLVEDLYFFNLIAPLGPIVYLPAPLVGYRIREGSLSSNRLRLTEAETVVFELLEGHYKRLGHPQLRQVFREAFALKRRLYAKVLLGTGDVRKARNQLWRSVKCCGYPISIVKSLALLFLTLAPPGMHPKWPTAERSLNTVGTGTDESERPGSEVHWEGGIRNRV